MQHLLEPQRSNPSCRLCKDWGIFFSD